MQKVTGELMKKKNVSLFWFFLLTIIISGCLKVVNTEPDGEKTDVPIETIIYVNFNENLKADTVNSSSVILTEKDTGIIVAGYPGVIDNEISFTPLSELKYNTIYQVCLKKGITTSDGKSKLKSDYIFKFTTRKAPPELKVLSTTPLNGSVNVLDSSIIIINFDSEIDPYTINSSSFSVTFDENELIPGEFAYDKSQVSFLTTYLLPLGSKVTVRLSTDIKSKSGGRLSEGMEFSFLIQHFHGQLDSEFGTNGKVITPISSSDDTGQSILTQPDGKIIVVGY